MDRTQQQGAMPADMAEKVGDSLPDARNYQQGEIDAKIAELVSDPTVKRSPGECLDIFVPPAMIYLRERAYEDFREALADAMAGWARTAAMDKLALAESVLQCCRLAMGDEAEEALAYEDSTAQIGEAE
jgi:hypothetical protein